MFRTFALPIDEPRRLGAVHRDIKSAHVLLTGPQAKTVAVELRLEAHRIAHAAGVVLNIRLLDHPVVGDGTYASLRERGDFP